MCRGQMIAFLPDALYYDWEYPISALKITPAYPKFAERLGHRDILGSLMQLGIDRCKLGDILVGEQEAYLLCEETVADYFAEHLEKIRHTLVKVEPCSLTDLKVTQEFQSQDGIVTSDRIDAVIASFIICPAVRLRFCCARKGFCQRKADAESILYLPCG